MFSLGLFETMTIFEVQYVADAAHMGNPDLGFISRFWISQ
jgi:hypothetical protein